MDEEERDAMMGHPDSGTVVVHVGGMAVPVEVCTNRDLDTDIGIGWVAYVEDYRIADITVYPDSIFFFVDGGGMFVEPGPWTWDEVLEEVVGQWLTIGEPIRVQG